MAKDAAAAGILAESSLQRFRCRILENKRKINQIQHHIKRLKELGIDTEPLQFA